MRHKQAIPLLIVPVLLVLSCSVMLFVRVVSQKQGVPGVECWDRNENGQCDLRTEDIDGNRICDVRDCYGIIGKDGLNGENGTRCWDRNKNLLCELDLEDFNGDGACNVSDCYYVINGTRCYDNFNITSHTIDDCKGEDFVFVGNKSITPFCFDLNGNNIGDLTTEDRNGDGVVDGFDCNGLKGRRCWDDDNQGDCDISEGGTDGCNVTDCRGERGALGESIWDLNHNGECDLLTEDINGDGNCTANDVIGDICWDLNHNFICNLVTEDLNHDGVCNLTDCQTNTMKNTSINADPNTFVKRGSGDPATSNTYMTYVNQLNASTVTIEHVLDAPSDVFHNFGGRLITQTVTTSDIASLFITASGIVVVEDDLVIDRDLTTYSGMIVPHSWNNITLYSSNVTFQGNAILRNVNTRNGVLRLRGQITTQQKIVANELVSNGNIIFYNLPFVNGSLNVTGYVQVYTIQARNRNDYIRLNLGSGGVLISKYIYNPGFADENYATLRLIYYPGYYSGAPLDDIYIWTKEMGVTGWPIGNSPLQVSGGIYAFNSTGPATFQTGRFPRTTIVTSNTSDLVISAGSINVPPVNFYVNNLSGKTDTDLVLQNTYIGDELETDFIGEYTTGSSTTLVNGIYLLKSLASYTPYLINYYEVLSFPTLLSGIYAVSQSATFKIERFGVKVSIICTQEVRAAATTSNIISLANTLPSRFRPTRSLTFTGIPVYTNNTLSYSGTFGVFTSGFMFVQASYITANRFFTASSHQNGVSTFTVDYII